MIHKFLLFLTICFASVSYAQYSSSPFSTQGIGEAGGLEDPQFGGIGNCRTAVIDSATVNFFNPSSYASLAKGQPLLSIGISGRLSTYSTGNITSHGRVAGLNQIAMAVPVSKHIGFALGLQPFSRRGYNIVQKDYYAPTNDTFRYTYLGYGSTQQVFGGLAAHLLDVKRHQLSIGVNYGFVFGSVTNERRSELIGQEPKGGNDMKIDRLHSGYYSVGLNYLIKFSEENQQLRLAAVFNPEQKLRATREHYLFYAADVTDQEKYTTLDSTINNKGTISYPASTSLGFTYTFRPKTGTDYTLKSVYQISVFGDLTTTLWKNYATNFSNEHESNIFRNTQRAYFGIQFTPNFNSHDRTVGKTYFNRIRYRTGAYAGTLPNNENGSQLYEYGVTIGLGLPIASQKTNSSFNFSFQYGKRQSNEPAGLKESFMSVNFGVILAPASYDKWFKKYKLD